jgi:hypothetical protein
MGLGYNVGLGIYYEAGVVMWDWSYDMGFEL